MNIIKLFKYNAISVFLYEKYLDYKNKNVDAYIFVATTGRSASNTLTELFKSVEYCVSLHEPYPAMHNGNYKNKSINNSLIKLNDIKIINIKESALNSKYYLETNHMFVKNFIKLIIDRLPHKKIKIIHLVRDPVQVASSFYSLNSIPGKSKRGKKYLLDPKDPNNEIYIYNYLFSDDLFKHDFYKCLWYWYETEARIRKYKNEYPQLSWFKIESTSLNNIEDLKQMMSFLEVEVTDNFFEQVGIKLNMKQKEKTNTGLTDAHEKHKQFKKLLIQENYL